LNLSHEEYSDILNKALSNGGEYAEIFFEEVYSNFIIYDNGKFEGSNFSSRKGASLRVVDGDETIFAHTNNPNYENLLQLSENLSKSASSMFKKNNIKIENFEKLEDRGLNDYDINFNDIGMNQKIEKINLAVNTCKEYDSRIKQITVRYGDTQRKVKIINSEGKIVEDIRNYPIFYVVTIAKNENDEMFTGLSGNSENKGFEFFTDEMIIKASKEACNQAIVQLEGEDAPAGEFTVILSSEAGGTMVHEACGHGMEADLVLSGSVYRDKVGKKIASEKITVIDDGTLPNKRGTLNYDDECNKTEKTVLIENGVLKGYMHSRITAKKFGVEPTGNGRRETYMHLPIVRMRNTLIAPGKDDPDEILKSVENGIFVKKMGGGQVDVISGDFQFGISEGYLIENGKLTKAIRGASLVGNGLKVLQSIDMVGNDLGFAVGTCGKDGQGAPVSDAQPTVRIPKMVVGGVVKGGDK
jgi:TldD protein